jgi:hypothetical protein
MPSGNPFSVRARSNPVTEVIRSRWRVRGDSEARGLPTHGSPPPYRALPYLTRPRRSISLSRCRHVRVEASPNPVPTIDASERRNETRWRMCLHLSSEPVKAALFVVPAQRRDQRRANDPARVLVAACRSAAPGNEREDERQHDQCSHGLMVPRHAPTTAAGERTTEAGAEPIDPRDALDSSGDVKHGPSPRTWGLSDLNPPRGFGPAPSSSAERPQACRNDSRLLDRRCGAASADWIGHVTDAPSQGMAGTRSPLHYPDRVGPALARVCRSSEPTCPAPLPVALAASEPRIAILICLDCRCPWAGCQSGCPPLLERRSFAQRLLARLIRSRDDTGDNGGWRDRPP